MSFAIAGMAGIVAFGWGSAAPAKAERTAPVRELICRMVDAAAETYRLPSSFLTRVLAEKRVPHRRDQPGGGCGRGSIHAGNRS